MGLCTLTCVQMYVYMNAGSLRGQKKASDPVELRLHEVEPPGVGADSLEEQQGFFTSEPSPQPTKFSSRIGSQLYSKGHS